MRQAFVKFQIAIVARKSRPAITLVRSYLIFIRIINRKLFEINSNYSTDGVLTDAVDAGSEDVTFVDVFGAIASGESWRTGTRVVADAINARTAILAGIGRSAVVDVLQAKVSSESGGAATLVAVDQIETLFAVDALNRETFVDVVFAVHSLETF